MVRIKRFLPVILGLICSITSCKKVEDIKPNVLFISVDDLRYQTGYFEDQIINTPILNQFAKEGTLFTNHYVQVPTCGASRYALITGMRPLKRLHLQNNTFDLELAGLAEVEKPESFIHHLKRNGYYTVGIGKISHSADGLIYGYKEQPSTKREMPHSWNEFNFNSGKWKTGWNAFFAYADGENRQSLNNKVRPYESADVKDEGYPDGLTTQLAIEKLNTLKQKEQPFFLGVGLFKPHLPFNAPKKYWDHYDRDLIALSPNPNPPHNVHVKSLHQSGEFNSYQLTDEVANLKQGVSDAYAKKLRHAYYASISYVDAQIGKILQTLKALELDKNTIVVIWGDHGWHLGDQRIWGKHTLFENALKSALLIKIPGIGEQPKKISSIVETIDIYPTLIELCDLKLPYQTDGQSLVPLMKQKQNPLHDNMAYSFFKNGISMRTSRYRITKYYRKELPNIELYDHLNDPYETTNIAEDQDDIVKELLPLLEQGNTGIFK